MAMFRRPTLFIGNGLGYISQEAVNMNYAVVKAAEAERLNAGLRNIYETALSNWEMNGGKGARPNEPNYYSSDVMANYSYYQSNGAGESSNYDPVSNIFSNGDPTGGYSVARAQGGIGANVIPSADYIAQGMGQKIGVYASTTSTTNAGNTATGGNGSTSYNSTNRTNGGNAGTGINFTPTNEGYSVDIAGNTINIPNIAIYGMLGLMAFSMFKRSR